uniref:Beta-defensin-like domain-containing protein n=1 Tax=Equus caballus TaxID=9796 RepID=A0A3Q2LHS2_HORSE
FKLHFILPSQLFCLISLLGFTNKIQNPVSCLRNGGVCVPFGCLPGMKPVGTCGFREAKCFKRK